MKRALAVGVVAALCLSGCSFTYGAVWHLTTPHVYTADPATSEATQLEQKGTQYRPYLDAAGHVHVVCETGLRPVVRVVDVTKVYRDEDGGLGGDQGLAFGAVVFDVLGSIITDSMTGIACAQSRTRCWELGLGAPFLASLTYGIVAIATADDPTLIDKQYSEPITTLGDMTQSSPMACPAGLRVSLGTASAPVATDGTIAPEDEQALAVSLAKAVDDERQSAESTVPFAPTSSLEVGGAGLDASAIFQSETLDSDAIDGFLRAHPAAASAPAANPTAR